MMKIEMKFSHKTMNNKTKTFLIILLLKTDEISADQVHHQECRRQEKGASNLNHGHQEEQRR